MNSHSNTRSQLAPWENRLVVVIGTLKTVKRRPEGGADLLLVNCKVRLFDPDLVLADQPYIPIDHMWDRVLNPETVPTQLLTHQSAAGYVHQYARADGSVDWTVQSCDAVRLENSLVPLTERLQLIAPHERRDYRRRKYREILDYADAGVPTYSMSTPTSHVLQLIRNNLAEIEADLAREALAPHNGPCRKLRAADPFAGLRRRNRKEAAA